MDATVFLRFIRMCRNMFLVLALVGIGILVPVHISNQTDFGGKDSSKENKWIMNITPIGVFGKAQWAQVIVAYIFDIVVAGFLWWNYRKILSLRRSYFESEDYQNSLHSRTLMLYDLPREASSDEGIARVIDSVVPNSSFARTAVARNVKDLPDLIQQHEHTVRKLEEVLAKYLKNPQSLPPNRPTCKPSKKDRAYESYPRDQKLDAIDYYTKRIQDLEVEIKEVRASVDKRGSMPYGFASYSDIAEAHSIAYSCRKKHPYNCSIVLAPKPMNIIWANMPLSSSTRRRKRMTNNFWIFILTLLWIGPNALIAIFLVNLTNLGKVWKAFNESLLAHKTIWGIVQGLAAPTVTSLVYLVLPMIFRRMAVKSGDQTKTGRDRHVVAKLFAFFVLNNLIVFSVFGSLWSFVSGVIKKTKNHQDAWDAIYDEDIASGLFTSFCTNSAFWVTYLLQRQLGAATDLAQLWSLTQRFFMRNFSSPTPRELIEFSAPPPFDYASYYTYFLFYSTVTLCFAGIQPLVLLATALYFSIDTYLKKYLILYRFVTKNESEGMAWKVLFNRFIFSVILGNLVVMLTTWVRGDGNHIQFFATLPLPFLMIGFKIYCSNTFDTKMRYYSLRNISKNPEAAIPKDAQMRNERLASRFGHPSLYKKLITPMVHQKAQNLLPSVYSGRLTDGREADSGDLMSVSGYSDMYALDSMQNGKRGKKMAGVPGFEFVSESHMDFEYYKNRAEFTEQHGGGEMYGRDITRPGTPGSFVDMSRPGTPGMSGRASPFAPGGHGPGQYQHQRLPTNMSASSYAPYRPGSTDPPQHSRYGSRTDYPERSGSPFYSHDNSSGTALVRHAEGTGRVSPSPAVGLHPNSRPASPGPTIGALGGGVQGYSNLVQHEETDPAQYDYFRGGSRPQRQPTGGYPAQQGQPAQSYGQPAQGYAGQQPGQGYAGHHGQSGQGYPQGHPAHGWQ